MPIQHFNPAVRRLFGRARCGVALAGFVLLAFAVTAAAQQSVPYASDLETTAAGPVRIVPIQHASVMLEWQGKVIYVDPVGVPYFKGMPKADLVLITHDHSDHMDPKTIALIQGPRTIFVVPPVVKKTVTDAQVVMTNGESHTVELGGVQIPIEAVPMYNMVRKRPDGEYFHPKGQGNGYILTLGGKRIYFSGDTECTPEVKALRNIDVAFLCMNLPYTMPVSEAAACVKEFRPKVVYPYHYRGQNTETFAADLKGVPGVEVRLRNFYQPPPGESAAK